MTDIENWNTITIEECCEILDHKRIPINAEEREKRIGSIPYYGANGIQGFIDDFIFDEDLILIAEDGGYFNEFATRPIAYRISGRSWVNNHAHVLKAKPAFVQDAIFYFLEHKDIQPFIVGGTRSKLNQASLRSITIDLPRDKNEQTQIATILSTIDKAIEQTEAIIAKHQRIKTGLMQDLLTLGIDENGNIRSEKTHEFKDSPLGRIPVGWECKKIESLLKEGVLSAVQDGNHGELHPKSRDFVEEGVPFIMASDIANGQIDIKNSHKITEQLYQSLRVGFAQPGDVLLSHKASIGFVALVPEQVKRLMLTPQITYYRIADKRQLTPVFLAHFFRSDIFQESLKNLAKQSTRDYIGILAQRQLLVMFPKKQDEQQRISNALNAIEEQQIDTTRNLAKLKSTKTGLMQDLLTGEVRVTNLFTELTETE